MPQLVLPAPVIAQQAAGGGNLFMLVILAAMAVMLLLSFRRGKKAQAEAAEMRSRLTPGQEVMTGAGIFGRVVSVDAERQRVRLETAPGTQMDVHLQGVVKIEEPVAPVAAQDGPTADAVGGAHAASDPVDDAADPRVDRP